jgi:hypothetical protein
VLVAALGASGCNVLFQLEHVDVVAVPDATECGSPDEDGDCVGDATDVCPGLDDPTQADDGDHDGVGNACDPNQAVAHRIVHFSGFNDPSAAMAEWNTLGTSWTFGAGAAEHPDRTATGELQRGEVELAPDVAIEAGFTFDGWQDETSDSQLVVWLDSRAGSLDGHFCMVDAFSTIATMESLIVQDSTGDGRVEDVPAFVPGDRIVLVGERTHGPDVLHCRLLVNDREVATSTKPGVAGWVPSGRLGVRATYVSASLRYVAVYEAP